MSSPFANILHRDALRLLSDSRTFERGQEYLARGRVVALSRHETMLTATVHGHSDYRVRIWIKDSSLAYACTCPVGVEGSFCKHGVAVGLAWLSREAADIKRAVTIARDPNAPTQPTPSLAVATAVSLADLRKHLDALEKTAVVDLLMEEVNSNPRLRDHLLRKVPKTTR